MVETKFAETPRIPGGNYRAEKAQDGTWTLFDVPVFSVLQKGARGNDKELGRDWMQNAMKLFKQQEADGHVPPVHVNHHFPLSNNTNFAGYFRMKGIGKIQQKGKPTDAIFTDIFHVPHKVFEKIQRGELAYRSVELSEDGQGIKSLALLDDESPFFKLPMTTVSTGERLEERFQPAMAFKEKDDKSYVLFKFEEEKKMPELTEEQRKLQEQEDEEKKKKMQEEEEEEKKKKNMQEDSVIEKLAQAIELNTGMLRKIADKMGVGFEDDEPEKKRAKPAEAPEGVPASFKEKIERQDESIAELKGQLSAFSKKEATREKNEKIASLVEGTAVKLREEGWQVDEKTSKDMLDIAENAVNPEKALTKFSEGYKRNTPQDPDQDPESIVGKGKAGENDPLYNDVMYFSDQGPHVLEIARKHIPQFKQYRDLGRGTLDFKAWMEGVLTALKNRGEIQVG